MKKILFMVCLVIIAAIGKPNNPRKQNDNKNLEKYNKWINYLLNNGVPVHNDLNDHNAHKTTTPRIGFGKISKGRPFNGHKTTTPHRGFVKICMSRPVTPTTESFNYHDVTVPKQTIPDDCYYHYYPHNNYSNEDSWSSSEEWTPTTSKPAAATTTSNPCKPFQICSLLNKPIEVSKNVVTGALTTTSEIIAATAKSISNTITNVCDWFSWR